MHSVRRDKFCLGSCSSKLYQNPTSGIRGAALCVHTILHATHTMLSATSEKRLSYKRITCRLHMLLASLFILVHSACGNLQSPTKS